MIFADDEREANPTNFKFVPLPSSSPSTSFRATLLTFIFASFLRLLQMAHAWKQAQAAAGGGGGLLDQDDSDDDDSEEEEEEEEEGEGETKEAEMEE